MSRIKGISVGIAFLAGCIAAVIAWAEPPAKDAAPRPGAGMGRMHHGPGGGPGPMHAAMMEQMRAHDAKLDELVTAMNAAKGEAKVDAIAAVVNELVAQRNTRRAHMDERWKRQQGDGAGPAPQGE